MKGLTRIVIIALTAGHAMGIGAYALAEDETCRWGGDNGQSLKCFDCQKLVRVDGERRWINTCGSHAYSIFSGPERH